MCAVANSTRSLVNEVSKTILNPSADILSLVSDGIGQGDRKNGTLHAVMFNVFNES